MGNPTTNKIEDSPQPKSEALQPVIMPDELQQYQNLSIVTSLTSIQRSILFALSMNLLAEDKRTETQIALDLGVSRQAIYQARQNQRFGQALSMIMRSLIAGKSDIITSMLLSRAEKSDRILEICARIAKLYQPEQRNINLNAQITPQQDRPGSPQSAIESTVTRMMSIGYDKQSLLNLVGDTYDRLKSEGL